MPKKPQIIQRVNLPTELWAVALRDVQDGEEGLFPLSQLGTRYTEGHELVGAKYRIVPARDRRGRLRFDEIYLTKRQLGKLGYHIRDPPQILDLCSPYVSYVVSRHKL